MSIKTPGLGLIVLGILLLGAQLILYLGYRNTDPRYRGEEHMQPGVMSGASLLPGVFGVVFLASGLALSARTHREADDPRDGRSIPGESPRKS